MSIFFLPAFLLSSSLCLTWLQKGIWFLFALEGLDDFNARKRKAALNCDEISVSCKYEPLKHDLLVIANVSLFASAVTEGYLKTPALVMCMNLHMHVRDRKRGVFLHRHKLWIYETGETMLLLQSVINTQCIYFHQREISVLIQFSKNKCNMHCIFLSALRENKVAAT